MPPIQDYAQEGEWLQKALQDWLDEEFIPEAVNATIAQRAVQIFVRQRLEGENDLGSLVIAIVTEMQAFDFRDSFFSEFAIAILDSKVRSRYIEMIFSRRKHFRYSLIPSE